MVENRSYVCIYIYSVHKKLHNAVLKGMSCDWTQYILIGIFGHFCDLWIIHNDLHSNSIIVVWVTKYVYWVLSNECYVNQTPMP